MLGSETPCFRAAAMARGSGAWPTCQSPVPAESAMYLFARPRSRQRCKNTPSAIGERQMFPRQTKRIFRVKRVRVRGVWPQRPYVASRFHQSKPHEFPRRPRPSNRWRRKCRIQRRRGCRLESGDEGGTWFGDQ